MYLPGTPVERQGADLEDTDGDGKADKQTVFADGLHLPTGIELGDGGAYVSQQPNLLFLKDTDGDDKADEQRDRAARLRLGRLAPRHQRLQLGPGRRPVLQEGTFHHTQVETPYGPVRVTGRRRLPLRAADREVRRLRLVRLRQPVGPCFDHWGQNFVADASGGANYYRRPPSPATSTTRTSTRRLKQFLVKQWRPTCGCEIVSSRQLPRRDAGDYLLNNCIGFQGTLQYQLQGRGLGLRAPTRSSRCCSRAIRTSGRSICSSARTARCTCCDWFNPLIGHMQHSLRDPNRDHDARPHLADHLQGAAAGRSAADRRRADRRTCLIC